MLTRFDYAVIFLYFVLVAGIGWVARGRVKGLDDYFAGGHGVSWWMAGISHHVSGYSAFAFVGYAGLAYRVGFNVWTVFALPCFFSMVAGAYIWAPRWVRLRVITPVEYLEERFNNLVRQVIAWSGIAVKFVDEGTKLYSLAKVIRACTGLPLKGTIVGSGVVTVLYLLLGGLWAEVMTDLAQFIVQYSITLLLAPVALAAVGGWGRLWTGPKATPFQFFSPAFPPSRLSVFFFVVLLSYNGGTWGLAQRFYSMGKPAEAKKAALLSAALYLLYPLALYIPVWAAPVLLEEVQDPEMAYIAVAQHLLPQIAPGLLGLMVAAMFAATMSMVDSNLNALAAVFTKDIYARTLNRTAPEGQLMKVGLIATVAFGAVAIACGLVTDRLGGAFKTMIDWYAAVLGPVSIPLLFGMLIPRTTWRGALLSWLGGFAAFVVFKYWATEAVCLALFGEAPGEALAWTVTTGAELGIAFAIFCLEGFIGERTPEERKRGQDLFDRLNGRTEEEMFRFISHIIGEGGTKLILDLRGNPGGPPLAAREISSFFL